MKTTLLISTLAAGLVFAGCNKSTRSASATDTSTSPNYASSSTTDRTAASNATTDANSPTIGNRIDNTLNTAGTAASNAINSATTQGRMVEWRLNASDIQADLDQNKEIVRTRESAAGAPTGSMDKSTIKSSVEGRLAADSDIAALKLDVNAKKGGEVELEGKAHSAEQVGKAIALALDTDGVNKVTSKIKLDKDAKTAR
ncbi:MAG TPA: BON domain-containing protein [Opitutaceae bacterium]|nr:BON domain-containing protein [Opitutaceae bacterium]